MNIIYRHPETKDGPGIYQLIKDCPPLDLNSAYCYLLLADHFRQTCVAAEDTESGRIVGFVSAYFRPDAPDTLFTWQIAVHADCRGRGVARALLEKLLSAVYEHQPPRFLELSVNPSNQASRKLFTRLAEELGAPLHESVLFGEDLLGDGHEAEMLLRIGPLPHNLSVNKEELK
ncbi:MAG: diaminobutyrate acetyltransferase [Dehalogenimonas sp.]